ncbi:MAG: type II CRISPR RNA-guided endonuclease Cas9, partial [Phycisphaerales bacterium]|nr:type II CRISPR RNA-guided endonuclease Cas9 [Phycisphaerales bacterium]
DDSGYLQQEPRHAAHSRQALEKLVARMEEGTPYATARKEEFTDHEGDGKAWDLLPPVETSMGMLRNPAVTRALTEVRKLVNAIVRRFGKPEFIRVEVARDLKKARKLRERLSRENREREADREAAKRRILKEAGIGQPSRDDVERVLLAEECGFICPYTGRAFGVADVIGKRPQYDTEHIWPLSKCLDNGFGNKTLCYHEENRARKKNRTPYEAYHGTPAWDEIIARVKKWKSDAARGKLRRFLAEKIDDGFTDRQLTETRYISTKAAEYLGLLYGGSGGIDPAGKRRVFPVAGGLTGHLRREWGLNAVLSGTDEKNRADHRHHAVDALIIALTDPRAVQALQVAAEQASAAGRRLFAPVEEPWPAFVQSVDEAAGRINVSHRQSRRVSGKLHADSLYSKPLGPGGKRRIRKPVAALSESEVARITDAAVRKVIQDRIAAAGKPPKDAFKEDQHLPFITDRHGVAHPIRSVRIDVEERPRAVASGFRERFVASTAGSNHHTVVTARPVPGGGLADYADEPVTLQTAYARRGKGERVFRPEASEGRSFCYSLAANEYVQLRDGERTRLCRVLSMSKGDIELVEHTDGRDSKARKPDRIRLRSGKALESVLQKVTVSYLGEIRPARD